MDNIFGVMEQMRDLNRPVPLPITPAPAFTQRVKWPRGLPPLQSGPMVVRNADTGRTMPSAKLPKWFTPFTMTGGQGGGDDGPENTGALPQANAAGVIEVPDKHLKVIGQPSLIIYQDPGTHDTVIELKRLTRFMQLVQPGDTAPIEAMANNVLSLLRNMSQGPLTTKLLAQMGHPYGYNLNPKKGWQPRHVPGGAIGRNIGKIKGVRGSVPTLTVINRQSGKLADSWTFDLIRTPDGLTLQWRNTAKTEKGNAPYPYFLAAGTKRGGRPLMQAHGPFAYAPLQSIPQIDVAWRRVALQAFHREQANRLILGDTL